MTTAASTSKMNIVNYRRELKIAELKFRVAELEVTIAELTSDLNQFTETESSSWLTALDNSDKALSALNHAKDTLELALMSHPF